MLLKGFKYNLINISCLPTSDELNALVEFDEDVKDALPYLNAVLPRATYTHETRTMDFIHDNHHLITLEPHGMKVTGVVDDAQALKVIGQIVDLINGAWDKRDRIEPLYESVRPVTPLEVLKNLPRTNCGNCDEPGCMPFALKVVSGTISAIDCPELEKPEYAQLKEAMTQLISANRLAKGA